jgi:diamine N-acetyltransferase
MTITLREITAATVRQIVALHVAPDQQQFVAPNAVSLAQALFSDEAWYSAIYRDDEPVGFVMLADGTLRKDPPAAPRIGLWRLMVDQRHQGQGIGRQAVLQVIAHVRDSRTMPQLFTSYVDRPGGPEGFYRTLGFTPTGEVDDGEIVAALPIPR